MKVFVYSKKTSEKIATITSVRTVEFIKECNKIVLTTISGEQISFNTEVIKTTIYQN